MRSTLSPSAGLDLPSAIANARSAASGLENTYVDERNTAGRADPTESRGSKPRVSTAVGGRTKYGILSLAMVKPLVSNLPCNERDETTGRRGAGEHAGQRFWVRGQLQAAQLGSPTQTRPANRDDVIVTLLERQKLAASPSRCCFDARFSSYLTTGGGVAQRKLMHSDLELQQSVAFLHGSSTFEHALTGGGVHERLGTPAASRLVSRQKPSQHSAADSQALPFFLHGSSAAKARMLPDSSSWPGK